MTKARPAPKWPTIHMNQRGVHLLVAERRVSLLTRAGDVSGLRGRRCGRGGVPAVGGSQVWRAPVPLLPIPISLARGTAGSFLQDACFYSSWEGPSRRIPILQHFTVPPTPSTHVLRVFLSRPPTPAVERFSAYVGRNLRTGSVCKLRLSVCRLDVFNVQFVDWVRP